MVGWARYWDNNRGGGENGIRGHWKRGDKVKGRLLRRNFLKQLYFRERGGPPEDDPPAGFGHLQGGRGSGGDDSDGMDDDRGDDDDAGGNRAGEWDDEEGEPFNGFEAAWLDHFMDDYEPGDGSPSQGGILALEGSQAGSIADQEFDKLLKNRLKTAGKQRPVNSVLSESDRLSVFGEVAGNQAGSKAGSQKPQIPEARVYNPMRVLWQMELNSRLRADKNRGSPAMDLSHDGGGPSSRRPQEEAKVMQSPIIPKQKVIRREDAGEEEQPPTQKAKESARVISRGGHLRPVVQRDAHIQSWMQNIRRPSSASGSRVGDIEDDGSTAHNPIDLTASPPHSPPRRAAQQYPANKTDDDGSKVRA